MSQSWKINGQVYNHQQLMELKAQGLDPRKDKIEMKFITKNSKDEIVGNVGKPQVKAEKEATIETKIAQTTANVDEEQEFELLKSQKAWLYFNTKDRYKELKIKLSK